MSKAKDADLDEVGFPEEFAKALLELIWSELLDGKSKEKQDRDKDEGVA